jgi:sulfhydrogenase subunit beta (sulfur reductase)
MTPGYVIERSNFDRLFDSLADRGHTIIGPTVRDHAIVYDEIRFATDLPVGWTDELGRLMS